jgi:hypothetical protein
MKQNTNNNSQELSNIEIVTFAIYYLNGESQLVDIEDIAIKAFEINPLKFSWRKYPSMIDIRNVQYALKDASSNFPPLISGSIKNGYMITKDGIMLIRKIEQGQWKEISGKPFRSKSKDAYLEIERNRLKRTSAYQKFIAGVANEINERDYQEFVRFNDYFPDHSKKQRITLIENSILGDEILERLWIMISKKFIMESKGNNE